MANSSSSSIIHDVSFVKLLLMRIPHDRYRKLIKFLPYIYQLPCKKPVEFSIYFFFTFVFWRGSQILGNFNPVYDQLFHYAAHKSNQLHYYSWVDFFILMSIDVAMIFYFLFLFFFKRAEINIVKKNLKNNVLNT